MEKINFIKSKLINKNFIVINDGSVESLSYSYINKIIKDINSNDFGSSYIYVNGVKGILRLKKEENKIIINVSKI